MAQVEKDTRGGLRVFILIFLAVIQQANAGPLTYYMSPTSGSPIICRISNFPATGGSCLTCQLDGGGVAYVSLTTSRAFGFSFSTLCSPGDVINCNASPMFAKTISGVTYRYWLCNDDICPGSYASCPVGPTPTTTASAATTTSSPRTPSPPSPNSGGSSVSIGAVVGGIIAAIVVIVIVVLLCCCCVACCANCRKRTTGTVHNTAPTPSGAGVGVAVNQAPQPGYNTTRALGPPTQRCVSAMAALRKWMQDPADLEFLSRLTASDDDTLLRQIDTEHEQDGANNEITYLTGNPTDLRQRINEFRSLYAARNWWTAIPDMPLTELRQHRAQLNVNGGISTIEEAKVLHEALDAHIEWRASI